MNWTHEMDLTLAERVIRATREGVPLSHVWQDLAAEWDCTASVCEERWEKELLRHYLTALQIAEKAYQMSRMLSAVKGKEETQEKEVPTIANKNETKKKRQPSKRRKRKKKQDEVDIMIAELRKWKKQKAEWTEQQEWKKEKAKMEKEMQRLREEKEQALENLAQVTKNYEEVKTDYYELMHIVSRATNMTDVG